MNLGFTGTRKQPTVAQIGRLATFLWDNHPSKVHHGACVGSDTWCHMLCLRLSYLPYIIVHPPTVDTYVDSRCMMPYNGKPYNVEIRTRYPYLARDNHIVLETTHLVATPDGPPRPHSGTWYTIGVADELERPITIFWPDGTVTQRNWE
jgi:hypothetical protein